MRLDHHEHHLVSFDAANFKALHAQELKLAAETAAEKVRQSGMPYSFPPMNSRDRRMMHMACKGLQGVETASVGEGSDRFLVIFPEGKTDMPVAAQVRPPSRSMGRPQGRPGFKPRGFGRR
jgi:spoIIIJ-associated protein